MLIGFCGEMYAGKDTVAEMLMEFLRADNILVERRAFADALKEEIAFHMAPLFKALPSELLRQMNTPVEKDRYRLLMQWWGTEFRRQQDPDYWIKEFERWRFSFIPTSTVILIPDVRFFNEIGYIRDQGGLMVKVTRLESQISDHISEQEWQVYSNWDMVIENNGSLEELRVKVEELYTVVCKHLCPTTQ
jgi:phosphomevalonate kinase